MKHRGKHNRALAEVSRGRPDIALDAVYLEGSDKNIHINPSKLSPPVNFYDADLAWAEERHGAVSLFFAKEHLSGKKLRTRVEIRYAYEPFILHFWHNSRDFHKGLREAYPSRFLPQEGMPRGSLTAMESDREHSDWANFEYICYHGTQASLDFFRLPPAGIARFLTSGGSSGLVVEPILRIHTTAGELCHLLDLCEPIAERVRGILPPEALPGESR